MADVSEPASNLKSRTGGEEQPRSNNGHGGYRIGSGRRTHLTQEVADEILANIRKCGRIQMSVEAARIRWRTYLDWSQGDSELHRGFVEECWAAKREFQLGVVDELRKGPDWRAKLTVLERDPEDGHTFAQPAQLHVHNHEHTLRGPQPIDSPAVLDAEAAVLAELTEGGSDGQEG